VANQTFAARAIFKYQLLLERGSLARQAIQLFAGAIRFFETRHFSLSIMPRTNFNDKTVPTAHEQSTETPLPRA
jgi:hypothetical protein